jgi:WD40 repeat protein
LLNTLYEHTNNIASVEKLINIDNNKLLSFGSDGQIILWDINANETDISVDKLTLHMANPVMHKNTISYIENNNFVMASNDTINIYKIESTKQDFIINQTYKIKDDYEITNLMVSNESKNIITCNQKGTLHLYDTRMNKHGLSNNIGVHKGLITCMDFSRDERNLYLGTTGGFILNYDFRLNSIIEIYKYNENTPINGISNYIPRNDYNSNSPFLLIWTAGNDHEIGLWNMTNMNCEILFKVNQLQGKEVKSLSTEIPSIYLRKDNETYKSLYKFDKYMNISSDYYSYANKRLSRLNNYYDNTTTVQSVFAPVNQNGENFPFFISAGNDMTIRYWDISKESHKKSFLINAPNKTDNCFYTTSVFDNTLIIQSNENINTKMPKKEIATMAEYQNYNGISFNLGIHNEFDENLEVLKYCTKISDSAHKNIITDITSMNIANSSLLFTSSWDGTIKIWK